MVVTKQICFNGHAEPLKCGHPSVSNGSTASHSYLCHRITWLVESTIRSSLLHWCARGQRAWDGPFPWSSAPSTFEPIIRLDWSFAASLARRSTGGSDLSCWNQKPEFWGLAASTGPGSASMELGRWNWLMERQCWSKCSSLLIINQLNIDCHLSSVFLRYPLTLFLSSGVNRDLFAYSL